jgi:hypothetical protein
MPFAFLYLIVALAQCAAFIEGMEIWFGIGSLLSFAVFIGCIAVLPFAELAIAVVGFVGATDGWDWTWWQAGLLCFPSFVLTITAAAGVGFGSLVQRLSRR